eukprot:6209789-Pleurochrysis_carterae.AAC.4
MERSCRWDATSSTLTKHATYVHHVTGLGNSARVTHTRRHATDIPLDRRHATHIRLECPGACAGRQATMASKGGDGGWSWRGGEGIDRESRGSSMGGSMWGRA